MWFARIIEWEFPGFNVKDCLENLYNAQKVLEENGVIEGTIHRFLLAAGKARLEPGGLRFTGSVNSNPGAPSCHG